jgi:hypothetical protein
VTSRCRHGAANKCLKPVAAGILGATFHFQQPTMDEKQPASSWDDLLKDIGAAPAPEAFERKRKAIETPVEPPVHRPAPPPVKPKAGDWGALGSSLGIEPSESPAPPAKSAAAAKPAPAAPPRREAAPSKPSPPASRDIEAGFATIAPLESEFEEMIEEELTDVEFAEQDDSDLLDEGVIAADDGPEGLSGDAARDAFEALFSGSFALPKGSEAPPKRREPRESPERREEARRAFEKPPRSLDVEEGEQDRGSREGEREADAGDSGDRPRRRRRRRGRGRGGESRSPHTDEPASREQDRGATRWSEDDNEGSADDRESDDEGNRTDERDQEGETGDRPPRRRRSRRGRGRGLSGGDSERDRRSSGAARAPSKHDEDVDDAEDDAESLHGGLNGLADDDDGEASPSSHKSIPTWQEAIGVMVETNMQSRKNSPQRPSGGSRERGRGRGGRGGRGGGRSRGGGGSGPRS